MFGKLWRSFWSRSNPRKPITARLLITLNHPRWVRNIAFSVDGQRVAASASPGSQQAAVRVWETVTGRCLFDLALGCDEAGGVAFSPDGRSLAATGVHELTGISPGVVAVWDSMSGRELFRIDRGVWGAGPLAFSRDGRHIAVGSNSTFCGQRGGQGQPFGYSSVLVLESGTIRHTIDLDGEPGPVIGVAFSADGKRLFSATQGSSGSLSEGKLETWPGGVTVWDPATGRESRTFPAPSEKRLTALALPPGERHVAVARSPWPPRWDQPVPGEVAILDAENGKERMVLRGHTNSVRRIAFCPDGQLLATASADGTVKVWESSSGQELLTITAHEKGATAVQFSADGKHLGTGGQDGTVKLWLLEESVC
jgi:WD40 repeat protein